MNLLGRSDAYIKVFAQVPYDCAEGAGAKFHLTTSPRGSSDNTMAGNQFYRVLYLISPPQGLFGPTARNSSECWSLSTQHEDPYGQT